MNAAAQPGTSLQRESWLRVLSIFQSPRTAFAALRDDSAEAAEARQEPVLALILLGGFAGVLSTSLAGQLLDDQEFGGPFAVLAWGFIGGGIYGLLAFWLGGLMVHALARGFGGSSSYRQARHIVAFAAAPLAVSLLLVWPVRLAVYGGDVFRTGGSDSGSLDRIFEALVVASFAWTLVLVAIGFWMVSGVTWSRRR